jgi:hypothetical protein
LGLDHAITPEITGIMEKNPKEQLDFRPYVNENPISVVTTDSMFKVCDFFRKMHLRCLCVNDPENGNLVGFL